RTHPDFVRRLFELEIPEIADQIIAIRALAREAGYRSKVAVTSIDTKIDAVGACVGVRGTRIKNIVDELGGERIDIVRWNESLQVLIPNALQPAEIDEVMLCHLLGRAIVLVRDDQLSLAIGRRGQNVRLASKLVGWDIEIMTAEELDEVMDKAVKALEKIDGVEAELAERPVELTAANGTGPDDSADHVQTDTQTHTSAIPSDSTGIHRSALPPEQDDVVGNELASDESPDSEGDEASDDEIHDLALAVETSGLSPQGHEVTSRPHDDDQGAAIRIVTDA